MNRLYQAEIEKNMNFSDDMMRNLLQVILSLKKVKWLEDIIYVIKGLGCDSHLLIPEHIKYKKRYYLISYDDYRITFINLRPNLIVPLFIYMDIKDFPEIFVFE